MIDDQDCPAATTGAALIFPAQAPFTCIRNEHKCNIVRLILLKILKCDYNIRFWQLYLR